MERNQKMKSWVFLFLHLLFFLLKFQSGSCNQAQDLDNVFKLPGQSFNVSFAHYSGYVPVNEERALFYWFIEADEDPSSKPLLLWLNGGPGCSSIAYGEAEEVGPFHIKTDGKTLYLNPYSWNQVETWVMNTEELSVLKNDQYHRQSRYNALDSIDKLMPGKFPRGYTTMASENVANVLFLDSPVGVGFSYSNNSKDLLNNGDERTAKDSLVFLSRWLERFPQYKGRDFYLSGESYAGHYVPQLAQTIVRHHRSTGDKSINLKGYMVGNALTDDFHDHVGVFQFMWSTGLISDQTYKLLNVFCDAQSFVHTSAQCEKVMDIADKELGNIDPYSIFTPSCTGKGTFSKKMLRRFHSAGHVGEKYDPCTEAHSTVYFNSPNVQKALHVDPAVAPSKWDTCNNLVNENWKDSPRSVLNIYKELISAGLRIWMFSGDTDAVIPVTSTRYSIDSLKLPTVSPWRAWYDDGQVGGWTQEYAGLTFVSVRGAGHEVPLHRPKLALVLAKSFLSGSPMPSPIPSFPEYASS